MGSQEQYGSLYEVQYKGGYKMSAGARRQQNRLCRLCDRSVCCLCTMQCKVSARQKQAVNTRRGLIRKAPNAHAPDRAPALLQRRGCWQFVGRMPNAQSLSAGLSLPLACAQLSGIPSFRTTAEKAHALVKRRA